MWLSCSRFGPSYVDVSRNTSRKGTKKIKVIFILLKGTSSSDILNQKSHYWRRKYRRHSIMFQNRDFFPAFGPYSSSREVLLALKSDRRMQTRRTLACFISIVRSVLVYFALLCHHCPGPEETLSIPSIQRLALIKKKIEVYLQRIPHKLKPLQWEFFFY